ncbi:MAG TPA: hypothetical protein VII28_01570 [Puia sp.]
MKNLLLLILFSPLAMKAQFKIINSATINIADVRQGTWPISLQRVTKQSDTCYVLQFRTQEYNNSVIIKTLKFRDLGQLKYFQQGLTALKTGSNGDVAEFKDYTIKRVDVYKEGTSYILTCDGGLTNFQQPEADKMIAAINKQ